MYSPYEFLSPEPTTHSTGSDNQIVPVTPDVVKTGPNPLSSRVVVSTFWPSQDSTRISQDFRPFNNLLNLEVVHFTQDIQNANQDQATPQDFLPLDPEIIFETPDLTPQSSLGYYDHVGNDNNGNSSQIAVASQFPETGGEISESNSDISRENTEVASEDCHSTQIVSKLTDGTDNNTIQMDHCCRINSPSTSKPKQPTEANENVQTLEIQSPIVNEANSPLPRKGQRFDASQKVSVQDCQTSQNSEFDFSKSQIYVCSSTNIIRGSQCKPVEVNISVGSVCNRGLDQGPGTCQSSDVQQQAQIVLKEESDSDEAFELFGTESIAADIQAISQATCVPQPRVRGRRKLIEDGRHSNRKRR